MKRSFDSPLEVAGGERVVSASIGVALPATGHDSPDSLVRDADAAMYLAKRHGRARFELFDAELRASLVSRIRTEAELRRALEHDEMRLVYQPVMDIASRRLVGVEALLRWHHRERGTVPPMEFIPVAEEGGLIVPLGRWVLREAMRAAVRWRDTTPPGGRPLAVSVNLSARQMCEPDLVGSVAECLAETGVDPRQIALEITETVLVEDTAERLVHTGEPAGA